MHASCKSDLFVLTPKGPSDHLRSFRSWPIRLLKTGCWRKRKSWGPQQKFTTEPPQRNLSTGGYPWHPMAYHFVQRKFMVNGENLPAQGEKFGFPSVVSYIGSKKVLNHQSTQSTARCPPKMCQYLCPQWPFDQGRGKTAKSLWPKPSKRRTTPHGWCTKVPWCSHGKDAPWHSGKQI